MIIAQVEYYILGILHDHSPGRIRIIFAVFYCANKIKSKSLQYFDDFYSFKYFISSKFLRYITIKI